MAPNLALVTKAKDTTIRFIHSSFLFVSKDEDKANTTRHPFKSMVDLVAAHLKDTDADTLEAHNKTQNVFDGVPKKDNIKRSWLDDKGKASFLYQSALTLGPADAFIPHNAKPDYDRKYNDLYQGILCSRGTSNLTPIESVSRRFMTAVLDTEMLNCKDYMNHLVKIFTQERYETSHWLQAPIIFKLPTGSKDGNLKDLITLLKVQFLIAYILTAAGFDTSFLNPIQAIINIFLYSKPFFWNQDRLAGKLSDTQKDEFLTCLGMRVAHRIFIDLFGDKLNDATLFPVGSFLLKQPDPPNRLCTGQPASDFGSAIGQPAPGPPFEHRTFLFGTEYTKGSDIPYQFSPIEFDLETLKLFQEIPKKIPGKQTSVLSKISADSLVILIMLMVPVDKLTLNGSKDSFKTYFGFKKGKDKLKKVAMCNAIIDAYEPFCKRYDIHTYIPTIPTPPGVPPPSPP